MQQEHHAEHPEVSTDCLALLDQALELGEQELAILSSGEVEGVDTLVARRDKLVTTAWDNRHQCDLDRFREKLNRLQAMQNRLSHEALQLHERMLRELGRVRKEGARLSGYGKAVKPTPRFSAYLNKKG